MHRVTSIFKSFASRTAEGMAARAMPASRAAPSASLQTLTRGSGTPAPSTLVLHPSPITASSVPRIHLRPTLAATTPLATPFAPIVFPANNTNTTTTTINTPPAAKAPNTHTRHDAPDASASVTRFSGSAFSAKEETPEQFRARNNAAAIPLLERELAPLYPDQEATDALLSDSAACRDAVRTGPVRFSNMSVATFNVLAPCYKAVGSGDLESNHPELYTRRHRAIADFIKSMGPIDVLCLQEWWFQKDVQHIYKDALESTHQLFPFKRPFFKQDGLMIAVANHITVKDSRYITFEDRGLRCAILLHVQVPGPQPDAAPVDMIIANTHLTFPHDDEDERVRCRQGVHLRETLHQYSLERSGHADMPTIVMGDFNGVAESGLGIDYADNGFVSSFSEVHTREAGCSHRSHRGEEVGVDFVWMRSPSVLHPQRATLLPSNVCDAAWPTEFDLSDHRPVYVDYLVAHSTKVEDALEDEAAMH